MISAKAYNIGSCLATGAFSLHDLLATMLQVEHVPAKEVDSYLNEGLRELVESGSIRWEYHADYGNVPAQKPDAYDVAHFDYDWRRCTGRGPLRQGVPDAANPTLLIEATDELHPKLGLHELSTTARVHYRSLLPLG